MHADHAQIQTMISQQSIILVTPHSFTDCFADPTACSSVAGSAAESVLFDNEELCCSSAGGLHDSLVILPCFHNCR